MRAKRYYLAFRYFRTERAATTTRDGERGEYYTAGELRAFVTDSDRQNWIDQQRFGMPYYEDGGERVAVTKKEARYLRRDKSGRAFDELIEHLKCKADRLREEDRLREANASDD